MRVAALRSRLVDHRRRRLVPSRPVPGPGITAVAPLTVVCRSVAVAVLPCATAPAAGAERPGRAWRRLKADGDAPRRPCRDQPHRVQNNCARGVLAFARNDPRVLANLSGSRPCLRRLGAAARRGRRNPLGLGQRDSDTLAHSRRRPWTSRMPIELARKLFMLKAAAAEQVGQPIRCCSSALAARATARIPAAAPA